MSSRSALDDGNADEEEVIGADTLDHEDTSIPASYPAHQYAHRSTKISTSSREGYLKDLTTRSLINCDATVSRVMFRTHRALQVHSGARLHTHGSQQDPVRNLSKAFSDHLRFFILLHLRVCPAAADTLVLAPMTRR